MSKTLLEARGVVKGFVSGERYLPVIRGADLDLVEREMVAILGASGVGKSTLLHVMGTLDQPEEGTLRIGDQEVFSLSEPERTRLRNQTIGFIFQFHHLLPEFTALENVMMPLLVARIPTSEAKARARALLEPLGLSDRGHHRPGQLSGGEQQRVAVARALVCEPRIVLADEPTGNLDSRTSDELIELLRRFHEDKGLSSVVVTHNEKIASVCDRVLYMEEGVLVRK
jgi:lipoprotein-releasing system ATP-binding protein